MLLIQRNKWTYQKSHKQIHINFSGKQSMNFRWKILKLLDTLQPQQK